MTESAHGVARHTALPFYDWLDREDNTPLRACLGRGDGGHQPRGPALAGYGPAGVPLGDTTGGGGGGGHFARDLAEVYPAFSVIVQDLPRVIRQTVEDQKNSPGSGSITYQAHNFFAEQPVKNADVYFMRHIFHNHPDAECVKILEALLPALKQGARVLVSEYIVPPPAELTGGLGSKPMRQMDLLTMALFNAKERTKDEYSRLFQQASPALVFQDIHQVPDDPRSCIFEAVYQGANDI
ncbi:hypothetical protein PG994_007064 [Apiospora phragmitis]|uniref:O-methyltransferase C-terminal domain-containing protein n=1 Tax=Apiospora phragmitis TaxID=2905665 RepID=A0ABR1UZP9_9PEZI